MRSLELLAPARNKEIGIAAIDCGADAVYVAGPDFGARKDAGNSFEDIEELCSYAHGFGARVFVTYNTIAEDDELPEFKAQMLRSQRAGADAFIIRDGRICAWDGITVPLHASTQCAIRDLDRARLFEALGCGRIVLERQLPLETIREICAGVGCEVEVFVHGALCVCYSGDCRLSQYLDGRSADRGECIQACRSLYDLEDGSGRVLVRNKPLLSLKDLRLKDRLEQLALAGACSFKIEGRLKNASYVSNVVRDYSLALDAIVKKYPDRFRRASYGTVSGGFAPDTDKTFNRGYTQLYIDGERSRGWASADAAKSMGKAVGRIASIRRQASGGLEVRVRTGEAGLVFHNGDGFAFASENGVRGFRGDRCEGSTIFCKDVPGLKKGMALFRNIDAAFETELRTRSPRREIRVGLEAEISGGYTITVRARSEDGREVASSFKADLERADNTERMSVLLHEQLSKRSGHYSFRLEKLDVHGTPSGSLPLLSVSTINGSKGGLGAPAHRANNKNEIPIGDLNGNKGATVTFTVHSDSAARAGIYIELSRRSSDVTFGQFLDLAVNGSDVSDADAAALPRCATTEETFTPSNEYTFLCFADLIAGDNTITFTVTSDNTTVGANIYGIRLTAESAVITAGGAD